MLTLIAPVPWVPMQVERIRRECDWSSRLGVPAHITIAAGLDPAAEAGIAAVLTLEAPLSVVLAGLEPLGGSACLIPEEAPPLRALCARVADALGVGAVEVPHVTVARDLAPVEIESLRSELAAALPVSGSIERALLLDYDERESNVHTVGSFRLGTG